MAMRVVSSDVGVEKEAERRRGKMMRESMSVCPLVGENDLLESFPWKDGSFCFFMPGEERCLTF